MFFKKSGGYSYLVVGLGNPGKEYENTRHNTGFLALDAICTHFGVTLEKTKCKAKICEVKRNGVGFILVKPQTYMNLSGDAVSALASFYKISPENIIVLYDESALPQGSIRIRLKGSAGGHNGIKDLIAKLGTDAFLRIRIGIGDKPSPDYDMVNFVLGKFSREELGAIKPALENAREAAQMILDGKEISAVMNKFN